MKLSLTNIKYFTYLFTPIIITIIVFKFAFGQGDYNYTWKAGGKRGKEFRAYVIPAGGRLRSIQVKSGRVIDAILFEYEDSEGNIHKQTYGGRGGKWNEVFSISKGVHLVGISGKCGKYVDSIRFHLSDGSQSPRYGGKGGEEYEILLPRKKAVVVGFWGKKGRVIDSIGLIYKTTD